MNKQCMAIGQNGQNGVCVTCHVTLVFKYEHGNAIIQFQSLVVMNVWGRCANTENATNMHVQVSVFPGFVFNSPFKKIVIF